MSLRVWALIVLAGYFGWREFLRAPVSAELAAHKGYTITELEPYTETLRVLSTESYSLGRESDLSPIDIAAGWGPMADPSIYKQFQISQSGRWYYWQTDHFPIPRREVETHSSNIHIVPATPAIAKALEKVKPDELIDVDGSLIEVRANDGWHWKSSLSREDTGAGACELLLLKKISIEER
ncbi:MAG TPA: hypothetical protein VMH34_00475 [Gammaproteobacteria bacterium]|nr:hypothetical protein [Gammaproteobacteria bacterium]